MQEKKCRKCKETKFINCFPSMNIWKYGVWTTCMKCITYKNIEDNKKQIEKNKLKPKVNKIAKVSKKNKNTSLWFIQKTKDEIFKRQNWICIISWDKIEQYHHSFFWPINANYWEDRNKAYEWVWLSEKVHTIIHHWTDTKLAKLYRIKCVEYSVKERIKLKKDFTNK